MKRAGRGKGGEGGLGALSSCCEGLCAVVLYYYYYYTPNGLEHWHGGAQGFLGRTESWIGPSGRNRWVENTIDACNARDGDRE